MHGSVLDVGLSGVFEAALKIAFNKWCHKLLGKLLMCIHTHSWRIARMLLHMCEREKKNTCVSRCRCECAKEIYVGNAAYVRFQL